jgi:hypothetical protein
MQKLTEWVKLGEQMAKGLGSEAGCGRFRQKLGGLGYEF